MRWAVNFMQVAIRIVNIILYPNGWNRAGGRCNYFYGLWPGTRNKSSVGKTRDHSSQAVKIPRIGGSIFIGIKVLVKL